MARLISGGGTIRNLSHATLIALALVGIATVTPSAIHPASAQAETTGTVSGPTYVNAANTGSQPSGGPGGVISQRWTAQFGNAGPTVIAGSTLFVVHGETTPSGSVEGVSAFDLGTGAKLWGPVPALGIAYDSGRLFSSTDGTAEALDPATGSVLWTTDVATAWATGYPGGVDQVMATGGALVLSGGGAGKWLARLDETTGAFLWKRQAPDYMGIPAISGGNLVAADGMQAYDYGVDSGALIWHTTYTSNPPSWQQAPVITGGRIYVTPYNTFNDPPASANAWNQVLDLATGAPIGTDRDDTIAFADGTKFARPWLSCGNSLVATDVATGAQRWAFNGENGIDMPAAISGGVVYVVSGSSLYSVDEATGAMLDRHAVSAWWLNPIQVASGYVAVTGMSSVTVFGPATPGQQPGSRPPLQPSNQLGVYDAINPSRIYDSRSKSAAIGPGETRCVSLADSVSSDLIPPLNAAMAIVANVTVSNASEPSYVSVYPRGSPPGVSSVNFSPGDVVPNLVTVPIGPNESIEVYNHSGTADVTLDLEGFEELGAPSAAAGGLVPVTPARILDTRSGTGAPQAPLGTKQVLSFPVVGRGGVPATGASAVVMNVTVTDTTGDSYLTAYPTPIQSAPANLPSNLNWRAGDTVANRVMVPIGSNGDVDLYNYFGSADVVADVTGWYESQPEPPAALAFRPLDPARVLDTRTTSPLAPIETRSFPVAGVGGVPATAKMVVANLTATDSTAGGYLSAFASGTTWPGTSDVNFVAGEIRPNLVLVALGPDGAISVHNFSGATDAILDVVGWYG